jgi:hypothetical protein
LTYSDMNIFGVYIAPFVPMLAAAGLLTPPLLRLFHPIGMVRHHL